MTLSLNSLHIGVHFILIKPALSDHLSCVTLFQCSLGRDCTCSKATPFGKWPHRRWLLYKIIHTKLPLARFVPVAQLVFFSRLIFLRWYVGIPITGLILPHYYVCPKPEPGFPNFICRLYVLLILLLGLFKLFNV